MPAKLGKPYAKPSARYRRRGTNNVTRALRTTGRKVADIDGWKVK